MSLQTVELAETRGSTRAQSAWLVSWPLLVAATAYVYLLTVYKGLLKDGDTYWHIAAGHWILRHGSVPDRDPFSRSMPGAVWTAHEWLSEVILSLAHDLGSWTAVVAVTALSLAITLAILTRALLRTLQPAHAVLFAFLAYFLTSDFFLARPHMLAMPLMVAWVAGLVRANESSRAPSLWLLLVMVLWANMHGSFTLGLALAFALGVEAVFNAKGQAHVGRLARSWAAFLTLAAASSLVTPHGLGGIAYTWQIFFESGYALQQIGEWRSPNFHNPQPLELWLLAGLAMVLHQGLRLPLVRMLLLLGLLHLALKHARNIGLIGLIVPLLLATPLATHWYRPVPGKQDLASVDEFFLKLARPAGWAAVCAIVVALAGLTGWLWQAHPKQADESAAPFAAIRASQQAGLEGPMLHEYHWGGYLIYMGERPHIDGRAEMYGDTFLREYVEALRLTTPDGLEKLLDKYRMEWTLLAPDSPSVALLDHLPAWRRLYADKTAVVHVRADQLDPDTMRRRDAREARPAPAAKPD